MGAGLGVEWVGLEMIGSGDVMGLSLAKVKWFGSSHHDASETRVCSVMATGTCLSPPPPPPSVLPVWMGTSTGAGSGGATCVSAATGIGSDDTCVSMATALGPSGGFLFGLGAGTGATECLDVEGEERGLEGEEGGLEGEEGRREGEEGRREGEEEEDRLGLKVLMASSLFKACWVYASTLGGTTGFSFFAASGPMDLTKSGLGGTAGLGLGADLRGGVGETLQGGGEGRG